MNFPDSLEFLGIPLKNQRRDPPPPIPVPYLPLRKALFGTELCLRELVGLPNTVGDFIS